MNNESLTPNQILQEYQRRGLYVFPLVGKAPCKGYRKNEYKNTPECYINAKGQTKPTGIGVMQGRPDNEGYRQYTFDFDKEGEINFLDFCKKAKEQGLDVATWPVVKTSKGYHLTISTKTDINTLLEELNYQCKYKLAMDEANKNVVIEIRGNEQYVVKPGSKHPNGHIYISHNTRYKYDGWTTHKVADDELKKLLAIARSYNRAAEKKSHTKLPQITFEGESCKSKKPIDPGLKAAYDAVRQRFNAENPLIELLKKYGYEGNESQGWKRPDGGENYSIKLHKIDGKVTHFSTGDNKCGKKSDGFDLYVRHECDDDISEGYRRLFQRYPDLQCQPDEQDALRISPEKMERKNYLVEKFSQPIDMTPLYQLLPKVCKDYFRFRVKNLPYTDSGIVGMVALHEMTGVLGRRFTFVNGNTIFYPVSSMIGLANPGESKSAVYTLLNEVWKPLLEDQSFGKDAMDQVRIFDKGSPRSQFNMLEETFGYGFGVNTTKPPAYEDRIKAGGIVPWDEAIADFTWIFDPKAIDNKALFCSILDTYGDVSANISKERRGVIRPCISLIGMGQPDYFDEVKEVMAEEQGALARFNIVYTGTLYIDTSDWKDETYIGRERQICEELISIAGKSRISKNPGFEDEKTRFHPTYEGWMVELEGETWIRDIYDELLTDEIKEYCQMTDIWQSVSDYGSKLKPAALRFACGLERYNPQSTEVANKDIYREMANILLLQYIKRLTRKETDLQQKNQIKIVVNAVVRGKTTIREIQQNVRIKDKWGNSIRAEGIRELLSLAIADKKIVVIDGKYYPASVAE